MLDEISLLQLNSDVVLTASFWDCCVADFLCSFCSALALGCVVLGVTIKVMCCPVASSVVMLLRISPRTTVVASSRVFSLSGVRIVWY